MGPPAEAGGSVVRRGRSHEVVDALILALAREGASGDVRPEPKRRTMDLRE